MGRRVPEKRINSCSKQHPTMLTSGALFLLLAVLSKSWLTTEAADPNCSSVADLDDCPGSASDFCPEGVACGCKDQIPFCKCPSYQNGWKNYWYMGAKCEELWSTLDLILVVVFPAVALSFVAAVTTQWVQYCKDKPGKEAKRSRIQARQLSPEPQRNSEYAPKLADRLRSASYSQGRQNDGGSQDIKFSRYPLQSYPHEQIQSPHTGGYSQMPHQPLRRAVPYQDDVFVGRSSQVGQLHSWESEVPDVDYEDTNPFSAIPMQQFPRPGASVVPRPEYQKYGHQPLNYMNGQRAGRPYGIGHQQDRYT
ncbi:uncharacterized protein LOC117040471 [Lacerta agilis]|uniref:uncharacterized protein LOC117040471 n=1 Tax=Lacerta agilis TaxID=80427 RepID=UPI0014196C65|nr:uncharacterized protein LOC117040471 [Lacerta agilis]